MNTKQMIEKGMNKNKGINKAQGILINQWPLIEGWRIKAIKAKSSYNRITVKRFLALTNREPNKQLEYLLDAKRTASKKELSLIEKVIRELLKGKL